MVDDKFGLPHLHPSKANGWYYQQSNDINDDREFEPGKESIDSSNGVWTMRIDGPTSVDLIRNPGFQDSIDGCDMNFEKTAKRGYAYKSNDPRDVEVKVLVRCNDGDDEGLSISGPSGHHSGDKCCQGFAYMASVYYGRNPAEFRFRKEMWHVSYHDHPKGTFSNPNFKFMIKGHGWIGLCYCRYNRKDGISLGKDSVILELWGNPNPDQNKKNWILLGKVEDKGGWGNDGDDCNGNKDQVGTWSNAKFRIKSNNSGAVFDFKCLTIREIDAFASVEDKPDEPEQPEQPQQSTTIKGTFVFKQDINQLRTSLCSPGGLVKFYSVPLEIQEDTGDPLENNLGDSDATSHRSRMSQKIYNSSSPFIGLIPKQMAIDLIRVGTPAASPLVVAKIWDINDNVIYTSTTSVNPATIPTSYGSRVIFELAGNTHIMKVGDRIGVEYLGTSESAYCKVGLSRLGGDGNSYSYLTSYYKNSSSWIIVSSRDIAMDVWS